jgi:hypothetical protein
MTVVRRLLKTLGDLERKRDAREIAALNRLLEPRSKKRRKAAAPKPSKRGGRHG